MAAELRATSDEELRRCLEGALTEVEAGAPRVVGLKRRPFAYETSFAIDELRVDLDGGEELDLLVKDIGAGLSDAAAAAKPSRAIDPRREIAVYRHLLRPSGVPAPRFYGAAEGGADGRAWLFLERVPGEVLTDIGEPETWRATARWAAQLGAAVAADRDPTLDRLLLHRDRDWHEHWIGAAAAACGDSDQAGLASRLRQAGPALLNRLDDLPRAFVHGELYASNVIVQQRVGEQAQVKPVDWEMAGTAPFALDLAALLSGWAGEERRAMCEAFRAALPGERAISAADLLAAATLCELALALQWLGWSSGWQPPAEHRRDWAAEAERLLEEADL
ncbi:MAG TPA: aminoglycoside phosphotransferase family protein [Solirubrobacterales bacterium]|jgi:Ser/Thr protein kinase RdoA (MazF antagonist)|nr:aminoglycoside phosphotransferase family protein [Solirubrobacterales bacterium]